MNCCYFNFVCEKQWHELELTDDANARCCSRCNKNVYLVHNVDQFKIHASMNECVALVSEKFQRSPYRKSEEEKLSDCANIILRVGEVLINVNNLNFQPTDVWRSNFLKLIESAQASGYLLHEDITRNISFELNNSVLDALGYIFNNYGIAFYEAYDSHDNLLEATLGIPDSSRFSDYEDITFGSINKLEISKIINEKIEILGLENIRELIVLAPEYVASKCKLDDSEMDVLKSILASRGLCFGMKF